MFPMTSLASFLPILKSAEVSPYVFFDYGKGIIDHSALSSDNHVNSAHYGAGVDMQFAKKWVLDLTVSHQRSKIEGVDSESETRAWGQIRTEF
jgi:hemolysin activation/secretion protein